MDLPAEHPGGRFGNDDFNLLGIQHPAHETLPSGNILDLVEKPMNRFPAPQLRIPAIILLEHQSKLIQVQIGQAVIVEADENRPLCGQRFSSIGLQLTKIYGLSDPPHADDGMGFSRNRGKFGIPKRHLR